MSAGEGCAALDCAWDADEEPGSEPAVTASGAAAELREQYETATADEHHAESAERARRTFEPYRIVERGAARWLMAPFDDGGARRGGGRACEVAVLHGGLVVVHGASDGLSAFARFREVGTARDAIEAIGRPGDVRREVADRLARAMGRGMERRLDEAVFRHEAIDYVLEDRCGNGPPEPDAVEALVEALECAFGELDDCAEGEGVLGAQRSLHGDLQDDEPECLFALGKVYEARVYDGHAAVARLVALLDDEEAAAAADCSTDAGRAARLLSAVRGPGHSVETWSGAGTARAWVSGPGDKAHEEGVGADEAEALADLVADLRREAAGRIERGAGGLGTAMREALEAAYVPPPGAPSRRYESGGRDA